MLLCIFDWKLIYLTSASLIVKTVFLLICIKKMTRCFQIQVLDMFIQVKNWLTQMTIWNIFSNIFSSNQINLNQGVSRSWLGLLKIMAFFNLNQLSLTYYWDKIPTNMLKRDFKSIFCHRKWWKSAFIYYYL